MSLKPPFDLNGSELEKAKRLPATLSTPCLVRAKREKPPLPEAKNPSEQMTTTPWDGEKSAGSSTSFPKRKDLLKRRAKLKPPLFNPLARTRHLRTPFFSALSVKESLKHQARPDQRPRVTALLHLATHPKQRVY
jgi:hypothetical protein